MSDTKLQITGPLNPGDTVTLEIVPPIVPPTITGVSVSGPSALSEHATAQFTAKVTGTGNFDPSVKWSCSDGTISQSGLFTAPSTPETVTVTATSVQDLTKSGSQPVAISNSTNTVQIQANGGDDTAALQAAMQNAASTGKILEMTIKGGKFHTRELKWPAHLRLLIDPQVFIEDLLGYGATECMFVCESDDVQVTANGAFAEMPNSFAAAQPDSREYCHCISTHDGASNLKVSGLTVNLPGGDGVNFAGGSKMEFDSVTVNKQYRQGYSVTGKIDGLILNGCGAHDGARAASTGFDFEPNLPGQSVTGVVINNFQTSGNGGGGMSFGFFNLGPEDQLDITVNRYRSTRDKQMGIAFWNKNTGPNPSGQIVCNDCVAEESGFAGTYGNKSNVGWKMIFNRLTVTNPNQDSASNPKNDAAIGVGVSGGEEGPPGGVAWNGVTIQGGKAAYSVEGSQGVTISGTWNGKAISWP